MIKYKRSTVPAIVLLDAIAGCPTHGCSLLELPQEISEIPLPLLEQYSLDTQHNEGRERLLRVFILILVKALAHVLRRGSPKSAPQVAFPLALRIEHAEVVMVGMYLCTDIAYCY